MDLIKEKQKMKKKNPTFSRQDSHKHKKLGTKWIKPRGLHSKMREMIRGYRPLVKPGYGTPNVLKHMNAEGKKEHLITSIKQLDSMKAGEIIVISAKLGLKSKILIVEKCKEKKLVIANLDIEEFTKKLEQKKKEKESKKQTRETKKKKKESQDKKEEKTKAEAKADTKATSEDKQEEVSEDEKKKQDKQEKDKVLTQRDGGY